LSSGRALRRGEAGGERNFIEANREKPKEPMERRLEKLNPGAVVIVGTPDALGLLGIDDQQAHPGRAAI